MLPKRSVALIRHPAKYTSLAFMFSSLEVSKPHLTNTLATTSARTYTRLQPMSTAVPNYEMGDSLTAVFGAIFAHKYSDEDFE